MEWSGLGPGFLSNDGLEMSFWEEEERVADNEEEDEQQEADGNQASDDGVDNDRRSFPSIRFWILSTPPSRDFYTWKCIKEQSTATSQ